MSNIKTFNFRRLLDPVSVFSVGLRVANVLSRSDNRSVFRKGTDWSVGHLSAVPRFVLATTKKLSFVILLN